MKRHFRSIFVRYNDTCVGRYDRKIESVFTSFFRTYFYIFEKSTKNVLKFLEWRFWIIFYFSSIISVTRDMSLGKFFECRRLNGLHVQ